MTAKKSMTLAELWDYLDDKYQWVAVDESGGIFGYANKPNISTTGWGFRQATSACVLIPFTISDINPDWEQSLVERPKDWSKYVGCLGEFWDSDNGIRIIGFLRGYDTTRGEPFEEDISLWSNFRPYTVAEIEQLRDKAKEAGL